MKYFLQTHLLPLFLFVFFAPHTVFGQNTTVELLAEGIPGIEGGQSFSSYLQSLFQLGIGVAVVLAVIQIVLGGFKYMTTDAAGGKEEGKEKIRGAIYGLILALATVLILQTINPNIVSLKINFSDVQNTTTGGTSGGQAPNSAEEQSARDQLKALGVEITNNNPPCSPTRKSNCTNVSGFPAGTLEEIGALKNACVEMASGCSVSINGGTETYGHKTHGVGIPFVDLAKNPELDTYITSNASCSSVTPIGTLYRIGSNNYVNEGNHWHSCIGTSCRINNHLGSC
jgi:hypothetical protein